MTLNGEHRGTNWCQDSLSVTGCYTAGPNTPDLPLARIRLQETTQHEQP